MMTVARNDPVEAVLWMLLSGASFVGVTGIVRHLGTDLPAVQSAFLRFAIGLVFLLPLLVGSLRRGFAPATWRLFTLRGVMHTVAVALWFYAMARIPVAEVTAIGYLNPVVVSLGAALFLGETLALRRIVAIAVALVGAAIILRPGLREILPGHLAQLGASVSFGLSYLIVKRLSAVAPAGAIVAMLSLMVTVALLPFALWVWVPPTPVQLGWLSLVAGLATLGHYTMTRAFAAAPLTVTQPVIFLQLIWATLLGALVFGEPVDPFVLLGGGIIIAAVSVMTWREAVARRRLAAALGDT